MEKIKNKIDIIPYFENNEIIIYNNNCLDILNKLDKDDFDLILTDVPYGIYDGKEKTGFAKKRIDFNTVNWDERLDKIYFDEMKRVSKNYIIWGGNYYAEYIGDCKEPIVWDKKTGNNYFADGEMAFTNFKGTLRICRHQWCGAFKDSERGIKSKHPTQKPIFIGKWCLNRYSNENDIILDCFAGAGSFGLACLETNRKCILIEKEKEYCKIIVDRIDEYMERNKIF